MIVVFSCAMCNVPLTKPLMLLEDLSQLSEKDGQPRIPAGFYYVDNGIDYVWAKDKYSVNLKDLINTLNHPDSSRLHGCCGLDGGEINTICFNGHEIGTEHSDCWMPHCLVFESNAVRLNGNE